MEKWKNMKKAISSNQIRHISNSQELVGTLTIDGGSAISFQSETTTVPVFSKSPRTFTALLMRVPFLEYEHVFSSNHETHFFRLPCFLLYAITFFVIRTNELSALKKIAEMKLKKHEKRNRVTRANITHKKNVMYSQYIHAQ